MDVLTLYKLDSKGKTRVWSIYADRIEEGPNATIVETTKAKIVTNAGLLGGSLIETTIPVHQGKNIGRANETTPYQQACSEARSTYDLKLKEGYVTRIDELKESQTMGSGYKEPMLAHKFHPTGAQSSSKTLDQIKLRGKEIAVHLKKDGNRGYIVIAPEATSVADIQFLNRKTQPYRYHFPDLAQEILTSYQIKHGAVGSPHEVILDGEFFTTEVNFNKLNGILKAHTMKPGYQAILDSCKFHLFDVVSAAGYKSRHQYLENYASSRVKVEEYYLINATEENLLVYLRQFLSEGEEGLMIRTLDAPYQHKRTWDLIKYKVDQTEDYQILSMEESAHPGQVGSVIMKSPPGTVDRDGKPKPTFGSGTTGMSHEESREMWADFQEDLRTCKAGEKGKYLNQTGIVRFFEKSEFNIPRFPKFIGVRAD